MTKELYLYTCETCKSRHKDEVAELTCRFNPPKVFLLVDSQGRSLGFKTAFPVVRKEYWCDKWQRDPNYEE